MARPIWEGSINFGLINIGVAVEPMVLQRNIDLDLIDKRDNAPVGYQKINKSTGEVVELSDIVKGFEYEKGQYVILKPSDFEKVNPKKSHNIELISFVEADEIDPIYFYKPYLLRPDRKSGKSFQLLHDSLIETKKVGVGQMILRTKENLVAILPTSRGLILEMLRYPHEIRESDTKKTPAIKTNPKERKLAEQLIEQLAEKWDPKKFKDTYFDDLMKLIKKRVASHTTTRVEEVEEESFTPSKPSSQKDVMSLLRKSLSRSSISKKSPLRSRSSKKAS